MDSIPSTHLRSYGANEFWPYDGGYSVNFIHEKAEYNCNFYRSAAIR